MLLFFEWLVSYLIIIAGQLYAHICPPPKGLPPDDGIENEEQLNKG